MTTAFWDRVVEKFQDLDLEDFRVTYDSRKVNRYVQIYPQYVVNDKGAIHYEWLIRGDDALEVGLHIELPNQQASMRFVGFLAPHQEQVREGLSFPFEAGPMGEKSAHVAFTLPLDEDRSRLADNAVEVMHLLIQRTWPIIQPQLPRDHSQR